MKKITFLLLLSCHAAFTQQEFYSDVKVTYEVYRSIPNGNFLYNSTLLFNPLRASFKYQLSKAPKKIHEVEHQEFDDISLNINRVIIDSLSNSYYFDKQQGSYLRTAMDFNKKKKVFIRDSIPKLDWELTSETRKIQTFECTKASLIYKGIRYYAWFTQEIPTPFGPFDFGQLPGLILELFSENHQLYLVAKTIVFPHKELMDVPSTETVFISAEKYDLSIQKYQDSITRLIETRARRILTKSGRAVNISNLKIKVGSSKDSSKISDH